MFMDVSSEMIHALLPIFLASTLGATAALIGLIEGVAQGTASIVRVFSGVISDRTGRRKRLAVIGYGLGALAKPVFALAATPFAVFGARFVDRIGKGLRGAPRDALVADVTPDSSRGAAFGLRQALDTVGALGGPLLAILLLAAAGGEMRIVFAAASIPAAIAVALLVFGVEEPKSRGEGAAPSGPRFQLAVLRTLGSPFWTVTAIGAVFTLARFSEAFLILRAQEVGLPIGLAPLVMIAMNLVYSLTATPAGSLSDRVDRRLVLASGLAVLVVADLVLARFASVAGVLIGAGLWGLHMGLSEGLFAAMVADTAPARLRGTAFGLFHLVAGVALFLASFVAGLLWQHVGSAATFVCGAAFSCLALAAMLIQIWRES